MTESLRDKSRRNWVNDSNANEHIQLGCMLRIADATELMAKNNASLIDERDRARRDAGFWRDRAGCKDKSIRSLKGQITKLKKQLTLAKGDSHD